MSVAALDVPVLDLVGGLGPLDVIVSALGFVVAALVSAVAAVAAVAAVFAVGALEVFPVGVGAAAALGVLAAEALEALAKASLAIFAAADCARVICRGWGGSIDSTVADHSAKAHTKTISFALAIDSKKIGLVVVTML